MLRMFQFDYGPPEILNLKKFGNLLDLPVSIIIFSFSYGVVCDALLVF